MVQTQDICWSLTEQDIAQAGLQLAHQREIERLISAVSQQASTLNSLEDLWQLHDFLSARRYDIEGKYEHDYSGLIFVLARLVKEKLLLIGELQGLDEDKLTKISILSRM